MKEEIYYLHEDTILGLIFTVKNLIRTIKNIQMKGKKFMK